MKKYLLNLMHVKNCVSPDHSFKRTQNVSKIRTCFRPLDAYGTRIEDRYINNQRLFQQGSFTTHARMYAHTHTHYTCVVCYVIYVRVDMNNIFFPFSKR